MYINYIVNCDIFIVILLMEMLCTIVGLPGGTTREDPQLRKLFQKYVRLYGAHFILHISRI